MNYQKDKKVNLRDIIKHDTIIHSIGFNPMEYQLSLDLDWITNINVRNGIYKYHISPSILILNNVWDIQLNLESNLNLTIDNLCILSKSRPNNINYLSNVSYEFLVSIECLEGFIQCRTIGGKLFKRPQDYISQNSSLLLRDRGGFSLLPIGDEFDVII